MADEYRLLYVTAGTKDEALTIADALIGEHLIACANIIDGVTSVYRWEGKVQRDQEVVLIAKTAASRVEAVIRRVRELHSYDCPCVVSIPIENGNPAFLEWISENISV
tara:strand:- start:501 stop:824 length:324 start_codon:yes stop_codon:yes gene_type:complete